MTRYDEHETCSVCGDILNDVGGCDTCHGYPYFYDEWYEDEEETAQIHYVPPRPPLLAGARNLIALIVVFIVGLFRWKSDQSDQIPF